MASIRGGKTSRQRSGAPPMATLDAPGDRMGDDVARELALRTAERDAARAELAKRDLAEAAVRDGVALTARLRGATETLQGIALELEQRNTTLAAANWDLAARVAERTAELERAIARSQASEARFRAVAETVPQLVWTSKPDGDWDYANPRWLEYTGQGQIETHGRGWLDAVHPDDRERSLAQWHAALRTGHLRIEHRLRRVDGAYRWFETEALPIGGRAVGPDAEWVGASTDIQDRKVAEAALRDVRRELEGRVQRRDRALEASDARFQAYLEAATDAMFMVRAESDGRFVHESLNAAFEALTGLSAAAARGREAEAFMPRPAAALAEEQYRAAFAGEAPVTYQAMLTLPVGTRVWRTTLVPVRDTEGNEHGPARRLIGIARDVTTELDEEPERA